MKRIASLVILLASFTPVSAQEVTEALQQQLEALAEATDSETEDDSFQQQLDYFKKHPLNLNKVTEAQLEELHVLSSLQIATFFKYRTHLGNFISIYELQAIPAWDIPTIKRILPYITISDEMLFLNPLKNGIHQGESFILARYSTQLEKTKDYQKNDSGQSNYKGGRGALLFRYRYNYKNQLRYGIVADKDPGEPFFQNKQKLGFDFYSIHCFVRNTRILKALALGDFTVSMGQGLIQWQSIAFGKTALITDIKRQGPVLRPYTSSGEFNFNRGAGITIGRKKWELTLFGSVRNHSATLITDSVETKNIYATTLLTNGYHRTASELLRRNNFRIVSAGGTMKFGAANWRATINTVQYRFAYAMKPSDKFYDKFAINGKALGNYSFDFNYTLSNIHLFGEIAIDNQVNKALITGMLISPDPKVDAVVLYRRYDKAYQALFSNPFAESNGPGNENGFYAGLIIRPIAGWQINTYADFFSFPWLKYRVNAPSKGKSFLIQAAKTFNKKASWYGRYQYEVKPVNSDDISQPLNFVRNAQRSLWRSHLNYTINRHWQFRQRVEVSHYKDIVNQNGFLTYIDASYASQLLETTARLYYFDTEGYESRIYVYEQEVPYKFSIPAFYGKGVSCYFNTGLNIARILNSYISVRYNVKLFFGISYKVIEDAESSYGGTFYNNNRRTSVLLQVLLSGR